MILCRKNIFKKELVTFKVLFISPKISAKFFAMSELFESPHFVVLKLGVRFHIREKNSLKFWDNFKAKNRML